jgi:chromosome segregation ATPase
VNEILDLLLRSIPIVIGGGLVQLVIHLSRRRAEVRQLDAAAAKTDVDADAVVVSSAERSVALAGGLRDQAVAQVARLEVELGERAEEAKLLAEDAARTRTRLARAEANQAVLRNQVSSLQAELRAAEASVRVCQAAIAELRASIGKPIP